MQPQPNRREPILFGVRVSVPTHLNTVNVARGAHLTCRHLTDDHVALILQIVSDKQNLGVGTGGQPAIERGLECALETLGNLARDREGRKCISRQSSWQTVLAAALSNIQDAIMDADAAAAAAAAAVGSAGTASPLPLSASDCLRHALVLLCRM